MPMISPASTRRLVSLMSSSEGVGSPEGWLWTKITEAALEEMASLNTSRGCTMLQSRLPIETCMSVYQMISSVQAEHQEVLFLLAL